MESFARGIIVTIAITFFLDLFTNVFSLFPWTMAIVYQTNMAAREASTYNTLFDETRDGMEDHLSSLPVVKDTPDASTWVNRALGTIQNSLPADNAAMRPAQANQDPLEPASYYSQNVRPGSKVVMLEAHGYSGSRNFVTQNILNQQGIEVSGQITKHGAYMKDLTVVTIAEFPLTFKSLGGRGATVYIPWAYSASTVGLHLYK